MVFIHQDIKRVNRNHTELTPPRYRPHIFSIHIFPRRYIPIAGHISTAPPREGGCSHQRAMAANRGFQEMTAAFGMTHRPCHRGRRSPPFFRTEPSARRCRSSSSDKYTVSLDMAQRPNYKVDPLTVAVGGVNLNTFTPSTTIFTNATTSQFTAESNSLNIAFNGYPISLCDPTFYTTYDLACDLDSAITNISVQVVGTGAQTQTQINEPDALFLLSASIILLLLVMNYRTYQHKQYKKTTNKKDLTEVVVNSNLSKRNGDQNEIYKNFSCNGFCLSHGGTS